MASDAMALSPPGRDIFSTLPAELYDSIFSQLHHTYVARDEPRRAHKADHYPPSDALSSLKNLRLASTHYAHLPSLLRVLFRHVVVHVTPTPQDLSPFHPYITHLTFQPPSHTWLMPLSTFRYHLFYPSMRSACTAFNAGYTHAHNASSTRPAGGRYLTTGAVSPPTFVKYYMDDVAPVPEADVLAQYAAYMQRAHALLAAFDDGTFRARWTALLKDVGARRAVTLETGFYRFGDEHDHFPRWLEGEEAHTPDACMAMHGAVGERVFDEVLACVRAAGCRVESLNVGHCVGERSGERFGWVEDGRLDGLEVRGLVWDPVVRAKAKGEENGDMGEVLVRLLRGLAGSLRSVELLRCWPACMYHNAAEVAPGDVGVVRLPRVERWTVRDLTYMGSDAAEFVRAAGRLGYLRVRLPIVKEWVRWEFVWRRFFRAIRYHGVRMVVRLRCSDRRGEVKLKEYDTGGESESEPGSVQYSLEMYLSNRGGWDRLCEEMFGDGEDEGLGDDEDRGVGDGYDTDDEEKEYWRGGSDYGNEIQRLGFIA